MAIHKTAIIEEGATLGEQVNIGPYAVIENGAEVGDGCEIMAHAIIKKGTRLGPACRIWHGVVLGGEPQDVKFQGEESFLTIGRGTVMREYVTAHRADGEGESTKIGEGCMIMANSHIAHNCTIGDGVVMANLATLGGFVEIGERAFLGGLVAIHQFVRVGDYVMLGGGSVLLEDVPPYMMATGGHRPPVCGLNSVGLMRADFPPETRKAIKQAYRIIFREGLSTSDAVSKLEEKFSGVREIDNIVHFIENTQRGISKGQAQ